MGMERHGRTLHHIFIKIKYFIAWQAKLNEPCFFMHSAPPSSKNPTRRSQPAAIGQSAGQNSGDASGASDFFLQAPTLSLPKGGGAIKGIDEKFAVNSANGTASLSLSLPFSPGRNGFMPALALGYNSGGGNGLFGLGWDLGFPAIQRKTDKRLPRYFDADESDIFMFSGVEDLVPLLQKDATGNWVKDEFTTAGYHIRRYRPRIEGGFSRIEKIAHPVHGVWWKVTSRDNTVTFFGKSPEYRIADPADTSRIFQWLPELSFDDKGNCVLYQFKSEDGKGYGQDLHDANRFAPGGALRFTNRYLKRVFYTNRQPFLPELSQTENIYHTPNPAAGDFLMEMVLDYGEHGAAATAAQGQTTVPHSEINTWGTRHDAFSTYRAGFDIRTARLCHRVLMFHHFAELGNTPCLVRSLDLQYRDWSLQPGPEQGKKMEVTYLVAATQRAYVRENGATYQYRGLPPVEFGYQELEWNTNTANITPEDIANAPAGLSSGYQWVDLYNEGIAGILAEQGEGWFYKENLGNGQFTVAKPVLEKPSLMGFSNGVLQLQDLEADGRRQVVVNSPGLNGYFELGEDRDAGAPETWERFRAFEQIPNVDLRDPNTRLFDLDGDGQPEIVITEENVFTWYPAAGVRGYEAAERATKPFDEEQGPAIVFADSIQRIFLADMSGDGLTDIARIRNGEVCYWPNLGYGRFGTKVTMSDAPLFDTPDQFNPAYIHLADVSGTGATDIIYLGKNRFRAWLNLSGNAWSAPCDIDPFFETARPNDIRVTDLLGNGTSCIVWSSPLPGNTGEPLRYIDLMNGQKPHVLNFYKNNFGAETHWTYKSSTHFYLEDKKAGKPWITKLPFPVQVVSAVTATDKWRNTRFSNQYIYHHGYYDHAEREFRGFGRVEQTDIEDFGTFADGNANSPYITQDKTLYQPPVKTITWMHTGAFMGKDRILNQFEKEYFRPTGNGFHENELPEPDLEAQGLSAAEYREALRACKGMPLRTETYELAVDDIGHVTEKRVKFFSAAFHNCHIQRIQPQKDNRYAVFMVTESEAVTYNYELPLQNGQAAEAVDPRIAHSINLRSDEYGQPLQTLAIAYPRWQDVTLNDPLLPDGTEALIQSVQRELHITYAENRYTNDIVSASDYRLRVPCEVKTYELSGFAPNVGGHYFDLAYWKAFRLSETIQAAGTAVVEIDYHQTAAPQEPTKRLVEQVRILYFADDLHAPLPFGQLNRLGLAYETYKIALTEDLLTAILGTKLPELQKDTETYPEMLKRVLGKGGYHPFPEEPGVWWIRSGIAGFNADAPAHFYLPERYTDAFGNTATLNFDSYDLYVKSSEDPLQNRVEVLDFDYRVLAPLAMKDINDNLSEVAFDILGMPAAVAAKGKGNEGDQLADVPLEIPDAELLAFFTGPYNENTARTWLGNATARHIYHFGDDQHPACAAGILREKHVADLPPGEESPLQVAFEYSDGGGTVIVTKAQAEPGPAGGPLRWIANGRTVLNNKGNPVKQYEPYFSEDANGNPDHRFEEPQEKGVTALLYYDAAGRTVRTEMPDGTYSRVEFSPWYMKAFDANDTVLEQGNPWLATNTNAQATVAQKRAAQLAALHANTPACTYTDSLGREVVAVAHNKGRHPDPANANQLIVFEEKYRTYTKLDAESKPLWLEDARGNRVMEYITQPGATTGYVPCYDMAGNLLFQHSNEAGDRWMLPDATGQPMYAWDFNNQFIPNIGQGSGSIIYYYEYDALRRPTRQWMAGLWYNPALLSAISYGDEGTDPNTGKDKNLRGQVVRTLGPEGITKVLALDFKGNLLQSTRQLLEEDNRPLANWQNIQLEDGPAVQTVENTLMPEIFEQNTRYDALNRPLEIHNWRRQGTEAAVYVPQYNRRGALYSETIRVRGAVSQAIENIEYDAKGQRTRIRYGNGTSTRYTYDPLNFRLLRLFTTAKNGTDILQDLNYTYDPVGNITQIEDLAQDTVFFANQQIKPINAFEYDALYRLIRAKGREHVNSTSAGPGPDSGNLTGKIPQPGDKALRKYTQCYTYDPAGNFVEMKHLVNTETGATGTGWTRTYITDPLSNRLLSTLTTNGENVQVDYNYDAHGNMLNFANVASSLYNYWDYRDMIRSLDLLGGGRAWYQYDGSKQRTRKLVRRDNNEYWERIYLGGYELYRRYANNRLEEETETHHLFADEQRILIVEDKRVENSSFILHHSSLQRYQYSNHLGSVNLECNADGALISYEEYHPYGTTAYQAKNAAITAAAKRYRYTGMERDEESGLAYHTARYYLPWLGRWGSCDPTGVEGGADLYEFGNSNPIIFTDPTGKEGEKTLALGFWTNEVNINGVRGFTDDAALMVRSTAQSYLPTANVIDLRAMSSYQDIFSKLGAGDSLASGAVVQEALQGGSGVKAIFFDARGVDIMKAGSHSAAELRSIIASIAAKNAQVDVHILTEAGLSTIRKGVTTIEGAALPTTIANRLPSSFTTGIGAAVVAEESAAEERFFPRKGIVPEEIGNIGEPPIPKSPKLKTTPGKLGGAVLTGVGILMLVDTAATFEDQLKNGNWTGATETVVTTGASFTPAAPIVLSYAMGKVYRNSPDIRDSSRHDGAVVEYYARKVFPGRLAKLYGAETAAISAVLRTGGRVIKGMGQSSYRGGKYLIKYSERALAPDGPGSIL